MKYLILHNFTSYGRYLRKGEVVDEAEIRSPRLRRSEGKIIPAVSSKAAPAHQVVAAPGVQVAVDQLKADGDQNKKKEEHQHITLSYKK